MTKKTIFKTAYGERHRAPIMPVGDSLTQQHFKAETDIRNIIKQYDRTGLINHVARGVAQYGDYSEVNEYREAMDMVASADASFMQLPAEIRAMFNNDAGDFFEFATNPANEKQMIELGLVTAPVVEEDPSSTKQAEDSEVPPKSE